MYRSTIRKCTGANDFIEINIDDPDQGKILENTAKIKADLDALYSAKGKIPENTGNQHTPPKGNTQQPPQSQPGGFMVGEVYVEKCGRMSGTDICGGPLKPRQSTVTGLQYAHCLKCGANGFPDKYNPKRINWVIYEKRRPQ